MPRSTRINSKSSTPAHTRAPPPAHTPSHTPTYTHTYVPPPSPTYTPAHVQAPSMFDTIKQGFSFGVGSSIAHNIFDSKSKNEHTNANANTNANNITNETKLTADKIYELYNKCLDNNINNNNNIDCNIIFQNMNNK